jgi:hypothetical protein
MRCIELTMCSSERLFIEPMICCSYKIKWGKLLVPEPPAASGVQTIHRNSYRSRTPTARREARASAITDASASIDRFVNFDPFPKYKN